MSQAELLPPSEKQGPYPLLKSVLVDATFHSRGIGDQIDGFDMGNLWAEASKLRDNRDNDVILANVCYATESGHLVVPYVPQRSRFNALLADVYDQRQVDKIKEKYESATLPALCMSATSISEATPSPLALLNLIVDQKILSALPSILFSNAKNSSLFFRGENTPQLSMDEAITKVNAWSERLDLVTKKFTKPDMNLNQQLAVRYKALTALYNRILEVYDIKHFAGKNESTILTKQPVNAGLYE